MIVSVVESSDEALAARAAAGDDAAFEALVLRYQHRVFRLACRLTSETDAPDVVELFGDALTFARCTDGSTGSLVAAIDRVHSRSCTEVGRLAHLRALAIFDAAEHAKRFEAIVREAVQRRFKE